MSDPFSTLTDEEVTWRLQVCRRQLVRLGQVRVPTGRSVPMDQMTEVELGDRIAHAQALTDTKGQPESVVVAAVEAAALRREVDVLGYLLEHPHASLPSAEDLGLPPVPEGPIVALPGGGPSQSAALILPRT